MAPSAYVSIVPVAAVGHNGSAILRLKQKYRSPMPLYLAETRC